MKTKFKKGDEAYCQFTKGKVIDITENGEIQGFDTGVYTCGGRLRGFEPLPEIITLSDKFKELQDKLFNLNFSSLNMPDFNSQLISYWEECCSLTLQNRITDCAAYLIDAETMCNEIIAVIAGLKTKRIFNIKLLR